jgi:hypothetical protein
MLRAEKKKLEAGEGFLVVEQQSLKSLRRQQGRPEPARQIWQDNGQ